MQGRIVTIFGGTGFLGWRIVEALVRRGFTIRLAARRPERSGAIDGDVRPMSVDVRDAPAVARAVEGATAVVNAVSCITKAATSASVRSTLTPPGALPRPRESTA